MSILKTKFITITSLCILFSTVLPARVGATSATSEVNSLYQEAKTQLPPDFYALYRIVDRIARANKYDTRPWQIQRIVKYDTKVFTKNGNLITLYDGVLENLGGDTSALACMISHEMAHYKKRHQVIGEVQKAKLITQFREEAVQQVLRKNKRTSPVTAVGNFVIKNVIGGTIGNVVGNVLGNRSNRRLRRAQQRVNKIVANKTEELEERIAVQSRENEFEADKAAYLASVRAGFDREGCLRGMSVLEGTRGVEFDTQHPTVKERIQAIKAVMKKYPTESLVEEGKVNLSQTQPLTYNLSENQTSLRVNSRHGASLGDDIDKMFGS